MKKVEMKLEVVKSCNFIYPVIITKSNYSPRRSSELGFMEGDLLFVVNCNDCDWWLVGQVGYIPSNYVLLVSDVNQAMKSTSLFIAKYDYPSRTNDDVNFKKGDFWTSWLMMMMVGGLLRVGFLVKQDTSLVAM